MGIALPVGATGSANRRTDSLAVGREAKMARRVMRAAIFIVIGRALCEWNAS